MKIRIIVTYIKLVKDTSIKRYLVRPVGKSISNENKMINGLAMFMTFSFCKNYDCICFTFFPPHRIYHCCCSCCGGSCVLLHALLSSLHITPTSVCRCDFDVKPTEKNNMDSVSWTRTRINIYV